MSISEETDGVVSRRLKDTSNAGSGERPSGSVARLTNWRADAVERKDQRAGSYFESSCSRIDRTRATAGSGVVEMPHGTTIGVITRSAYKDIDAIEGDGN